MLVELGKEKGEKGDGRFGKAGKKREMAENKRGERNGEGNTIYRMIDL